MECSKCNSKISPEDFTCGGCNSDINCITYRNNPRFYLYIVFSSIIICIVTALLIVGMNIFYLAFIILISIVSIVWGLISYLTKFTLDSKSITYYMPLKGITTLNWTDIEEFTVFKESERKNLFPKKIYTLKTSKYEISFPEMKHTMIGYSRFIATIIGKTKIYPQETTGETVDTDEIKDG